MNSILELCGIGVTFMPGARDPCANIMGDILKR